MSLDANQRRALLATPAGWIATGFGAGLAPRAPGTVGSAVAILPWLALRDLAWPWWLLVIALAFILGVWACRRAGRALGIADPGALVWDEVVGQWLTLVPLLSLPAWWAAIGFGVFRVLDIAKPWPIGWVDRRVHGGLGVMLDDLVAGAIGAAILFAARALLG